MHTLSTGRKVAEFAMTNGATHVEIEGGASMTDAEWEEYCAHLRALNLEQSRARKARRLAIRESFQCGVQS